MFQVLFLYNKNIRRKITVGTQKQMLFSLYILNFNISDTFVQHNPNKYT